MCVDILNFGYKFFKRGTNHWGILRSQRKVDKFVDDLERNGWTLIGFIDQGMRTREAIMKWTKRREVELLKGERNVPQGFNVVLGEMFKNKGITVHYSDEEDNDDTIAAFALRDNACIMSGDKDFYRYNAKFDIFKDFERGPRGSIKLIRLEPPAEPRSRRKVIVPPPNTIIGNPLAKRLKKFNDYIRGVPSPLAR